LVANDVLEVFSFIAFSVANTYTQSQVDGLLATTPGLHLIVPTSVSTGTISSTGTVSFSGATSISVNGVFSSTYENYKVVFNPISTTVQSNLQLRFRTSGTDNTGTAYYTMFNGINTSGTSTNTNTTSQSAARLGEFNPTYAQAQYYTFELFRPFSSSYWTTGYNMTYQIDGSGVSGTQTGTFGFSSAVSFDGFSFIPSSTTSFAGTIRVYGYKN
jgi:hypothetical protein